MNERRGRQEPRLARGNAQFEADRRELFEGMGPPPESEFIVDDFQREAIASVVNDEDTLVVAPTGAGKTYIALEAIKASLQLGVKAVYTTPLKALSNTKYNDFKARFEPQYSVGLLTGDRKIETSSQVVIATTEIYRNELYRGDARYSLVILDEVHFIADPQRGAVWEESIILTPTSSTLLMLSATISNAEEIAAWISEVRKKPCRIVAKKERPVSLRFGFMHPEYGILPLRDSTGRLHNEVRRFYEGTTLDPTGMKLRGGVFREDYSRGPDGRRGRSGDRGSKYSGEERQRDAGGRGHRSGERHEWRQSQRDAARDRVDERSSSTSGGPDGGSHQEPRSEPPAGRSRRRYPRGRN